jgi:hypothetical protein
MGSGRPQRAICVESTSTGGARDGCSRTSRCLTAHTMTGVGVFVGLLFAGLVGYMFADRRFARAIGDGSRRTLPALVVADSRTGGGLRQGGGGSPTEPPWLGWRLWGAPGSVESAGWTSCRCRWLIDRFELEGCEHAKRGVSALAVMEDLEVLEDRR